MHAPFKQKWTLGSSHLSLPGNHLKMCLNTVPKRKLTNTTHFYGRKFKFKGFTSRLEEMFKISSS